MTLAAAKTTRKEKPPYDCFADPKFIRALPQKLAANEKRFAARRKSLKAAETLSAADFMVKINCRPESTL